MEEVNKPALAEEAHNTGESRGGGCPPSSILKHNTERAEPQTESEREEQQYSTADTVYIMVYKGWSIRINSKKLGSESS